jgi:hypothetical protein
VTMSTSNSCSSYDSCSLAWPAVSCRHQQHPASPHSRQQQQCQRQPPRSPQSHPLTASHSGQCQHHLLHCSSKPPSKLHALTVSELLCCMPAHHLSPDNAAVL